MSLMRSCWDNQSRWALESCLRDRSGAAAVEFAIVSPLFIFLLMAFLVYGGWFWSAQSVQHLAAEGARAAVAGLGADEQRSLAAQAVEGGARGAGLRGDKLGVLVSTSSAAVQVTVNYDVSEDPLMALAGLVPAPPRTIVRTAVVRVGGY